MANIKLKDIISENNKNEINEMVDPQTAQVLMGVMIPLVTATGLELLSGDGDGGMISKSIRALGDLATKVVKIKPILKKLDKDPEIQEFLTKHIDNMDTDGQHGWDRKEFRDLLTRKLDKNDAQYISKIQGRDFPSVKNPETQSQMKSKHDADVVAAKKAKRDDTKIKKAFGDIDIDKEKIKNTDTGNDISLRSALSYSKDHPVYKAAIAKAKQLKDKGNTNPTGQNIF